MNDFLKNAGMAAGFAVAASDIQGVAADIVEPYMLAKDMQTSISRDVSEMDLGEPSALERFTDYQQGERVEDLQDAAVRRSDDEIAERYEALDRATDHELSLDATPALDLGAEADGGLGPMDAADLGLGADMDVVGPGAGMDAGGMGAG